MAREVTLVEAGLGNVSSVERALIQVGAAVRVTDDPDQVARARMVVLSGQSAFGEATQALVDGAVGAALRMVIERGDPFLGICLGMQLLFDGSDENGGQEGLRVLPGRCRRFPAGMKVPAEPGARERMRSIEPDCSVKPAVPVVSAGPAAGFGAPISSPLGGGDRADLPFVETELGAEGEAAANQPASISASTMHPGDTGPTHVAGMAAAAPAEPLAEPLAEPDDSDAPPLERRVKVPHAGWNDVEPTGDHYYFVHSYYVEAARSEDVMWMSTYGGIRFPAAVRRENVMGCQFHPEKSQRAGLKFLRAFLLGGWG